MIKIAGIVGSLNENSVSRKILQEAKKFLPEGVELTEVRYEEVPLYHPEIEFPTPASVLKLREDLSQADALIIVAPEYNLSYSAALKNLLDWMSRPTEANLPKPILKFPVLPISSSAGVSGGMVAQEHLRSVLTYLGADVMPQPRASFANVYQKLDENFNLKLDNVSAEFLKTTVEKFIDYIHIIKD